MALFSAHATGSPLFSTTAAAGLLVFTLASMPTIPASPLRFVRAEVDAPKYVLARPVPRSAAAAESGQAWAGNGAPGCGDRAACCYA